MEAQEPQEPTYAEAMAELESIMQSMEDGQIEIDDLATKVARASSLIAACRTRLRTASAEVERSLEVLRDEPGPALLADPGAAPAGHAAAPVRAALDAPTARPAPSAPTLPAAGGPDDDEVDPFADI